MTYDISPPVRRFASVLVSNRYGDRSFADMEAKVFDPTTDPATRKALDRICQDAIAEASGDVAAILGMMEP